MSKKVLVLMGWLFGRTRSQSDNRAGARRKLLRRTGYQVTEHDLTDTAVLVEELKRQQPDVVFNALHGNWGEDGEIQGLLDLMQIPYTHSGLKASAVGMDKDLTKWICQSCGIKGTVRRKDHFACFQTKRNHDCDALCDQAGRRRIKRRRLHYPHSG